MESKRIKHATKTEAGAGFLIPVFQTRTQGSVFRRLTCLVVHDAMTWLGGENSQSGGESKSLWKARGLWGGKVQRCIGGGVKLGLLFGWWLDRGS